MVPTTSDTPSAPKRRMSRRRLFVLSGVAIVLAVGWQAVERLIDIERYRPVIDTELEKLIKLPLTFGAMDLKLFPTPRLVVEEVSAGEGDFAVFAPEVSVTAGLVQLLRKELALGTVTFHDARLQMPDENGAFQARWAEYLASLRPPVARTEGAKSGLKVTLEDIEAPGLRIMRGEQTFAGGELQVLRVTGGAPEFVFDLQGAADNGGASARGALILDVHEEPRIQGAAEIKGLALSALSGDPALPPLLLDAETTFALARDNTLSVDAKGRVRLPGQADALGPFEVRVLRGAESLKLDGLRVVTAPLSLTGSLEVFHDKRWTLALDEATLHNQGIDWLVARLPGIPVTSMEGRSSEAVLTSVRLGGDPATGFSFTRGAIAVEEVGLRLNDGYGIDGIRGAITVENDLYQLTDFTNGHVETSGTMTLGYENDTVDLDLTGRMNLGPEFTLPEVVSNVLRAESGVVAISEFKATFIEGNVQLPALRIAATLTEGSISAYDRHEGTYAPATGVEGEATFTDGSLHVTRLAGPHSTFAGTVTPDQTLQRWTVSSTFTSDLTSPLWEFLQPAAIAFEAGKLDCTRLEGVFVRGAKAPESLALEATVKDAELTLQFGEFVDSIAVPAVSIASTDAEIRFDGEGSSGKLGPFSAQGTYAPASGALDAQARLRLADADALPDSWRDGVAGTVLKSLGEVPLRIRHGGAGKAIEISSDEPLALKATVEFPKTAKAKAPFSLDFQAQMPAAWLAPHLSGAVEPAGLVRVDARIGADDGKLSARADFADASLGWSILEKKAGFPLALSVSGDWSGGQARLNGGQMEAGTERIAFVLKDGAIRAEQFAVALEALTPLLPEGGSMGGRLSGSYGGATGTLALHFGEVHATIAPDLLPLTLDGGIARHGGAWRVENLAWAIGASRGTVQASASGGTWQGRVQASQLHGSELKTFQQAWKARQGTPENPDELPWSFSGDVEVTADTLLWAEATMVKARSLVRFTPGALEARELVIGHGAGQITGVAAYTSARDGNPANLTANLAVQGVDAALLEGLFLEKARGLAGPMNGQVVLTIPLIPDSPSVMHAMSGDITFEAKDGTLGKAGMASKLLGALRTTDLLRLRVPQLKDKGLTFKTLNGRVVIQQGIFRVEPFSLHDSAYVLEARATFDYPKDTAEGGGEVQVLEGVTGVARKIPILGGAANLVSKVLGVPIKVSGTAKDPAFGVGVAAPVRDAATP